MNEFQTINVNLSNLSEKEREQLLKLVERSNIPSKKRWRAQGNEKYYFIDFKGYIDSLKETNHAVDEYSYKVGNYFKTSEEAEFELNKRLVYQELKDYALEHNEMGINWTDDRIKWSIYYDAETECLTCDYWYTNYCDIGQVYFSSAEIAQGAISAIGEDRIKKYLFGQMIFI